MSRSSYKNVENVSNLGRAKCLGLVEYASVLPPTQELKKRKAVP